MRGSQVAWTSIGFSGMQCTGIMAYLRECGGGSMHSRAPLGTRPRGAHTHRNNAGSGFPLAAPTTASRVWTTGAFDKLRAHESEKSVLHWAKTPLG